MVQVLLAEELFVEKKEIFLGDVAYVAGGDAHLQEKIRGVSLGISPLPGNPRIISLQTILLRIERAGIDAAAVYVEAPERMEIYSLFPLLEGDFLAEQLTDHLLEQLEMDLGWLEVTYLKGADNVYFPQGELEIVMGREMADPMRYLGQTTVPMEVVVDGERWRQIYPRFFIEILTLVPVLKKDLNRNQLLTPDVVEIKLKGLSTLPHDYIQQEEEVMGMRLKRSMRAGEALRMSVLEEVPLVEGGDRVTVLVIVGTIQISMVAEARGSGVYGDSVVVRNLDSNRILTGRIIGPGLVQIQIGGI